MSLRPEERRLEYLARIRSGGGGGGGSGDYTTLTYFLTDASDTSLDRASYTFVFNSAVTADPTARLTATPQNGDQVQLSLVAALATHHWHLVAQGSGITVNGGADFFCEDDAFVFVTYNSTVKNWFVTQVTKL